MALHARGEREPAAEGGRASSSAFEAFFKKNYPSVVRLAYSVVRDTQRAQDVAQEVFLAAHRKFSDNVDALEGGSGWVRVAAVHTALNMIRGERRRERRQLRVVSPASTPSAEEHVIDREVSAHLRSALARLPRRSAGVLVMRHGGMTYMEIAEALGVKIGQVGTLLRRAESALCKEMDRATHD